MTNKKTRQEWEQRRELQNNHWDVRKDSIYNSGSETLFHAVCKCIVGYYLTQERGRRVSFEVPHPDRGVIDVVAWGGEDAPIAVECETNVKKETINDKLSRYVDGTPIRECFVLDVDEMPQTIPEAYQWVSDNL